MAIEARHTDHRTAGRVAKPTTTLVTGENPNLYTLGIEFVDDGHPLDIHRADAQYAAGAALLAPISRRWGIPLDRQHVVGHREVFAHKDCPGNLDIDRLLDEARRRRDQ